MSSKNVSVVLVHGAWADGSSWAKIIACLLADGVKVVAAPLLTSLQDDVAALDQRFKAERMKARIHSNQVDHTPIVIAPFSSWTSLSTQ